MEFLVALNANICLLSSVRLLQAQEICILLAFMFLARISKCPKRENSHNFRNIFSLMFILSWPRCLKNWLPLVHSDVFKQFFIYFFYILQFVSILWVDYLSPSSEWTWLLSLGCLGCAFMLSNLSLNFFL